MKKIEIFKDGSEHWKINVDGNWWFNPMFENSFEIFDLNSFYPKNFTGGGGGGKDISNYIYNFMSYGKKILKRNIQSVVEFGSCGGWFTKQMIDMNLDVVGIEGARGAYEIMLEKGIPKERAIHHDIRVPIELGRKFDIALCTEVAEHIEPPFSSQLIQTLTKHSDIIYFSSELPGTNTNSYHHPNEQPDKFWINLFDFYNFNSIRVSDEEREILLGRNLFVFVNKDLKFFGE